MKNLDLASRPLAAPGLISYRCKNRYGWTMIGATNDDEALAHAKRSCAGAKKEDLQVWDGGQYVPCHQQSN